MPYPVSAVRGKNFGGAVAFSPTQITGLQLWLDFSDATKLFTDAGTTPVASNGDLIYQANDKSGNNFHFTQATAGSRPAYTTNVKNGLSVARFSSDFLGRNAVLANTAGLIVVIFASSNTGTNNQTILTKSRTTPKFFKVLTSPASDKKLRMNLYNYGTEVALDSSTAESTSWGIGEVASDASTIRMAFNGSAATVTAVSGANSGQWWDDSTDGTDTYIGGDYWSSAIQQAFVGDIGEILVYSADPSAGNLALLRTYLNTKWAIY